MKRYLILLTFLHSLTSFGQIQIGGEQEKEKKEKEEKQKAPKVEKEQAPVDGSTEVFLGANWSATDRVLNVNNNIFGDSLGERAKETGLNTWSFGLGMRNQINKYLMWEGGITFLRNGEQYRFEGTDTSYSYISTYSYIGMPIKLYYTYGVNRFRLQVGGGVIPQMALKFRQDISYRTSEGSEDSEEVKTKDGQSSFTVSLVANVGVHYELGSGWGIYLQPEYRYQLGSTYLKTEPYKHYGTALGLSFGLTKKL